MKKNKVITKKPPDNKPRRKPLHESWHSQEFYVNKFAEVLQYMCDQQAFQLAEGTTTSQDEVAAIVDHTVGINNQDIKGQNEETHPIEQKDNQPATETDNSSSPFDTDLSYPAPTIHDYLHWIYKHLNAKQQNFVLVPMAYLIQLINHQQIKISHNNVHKLVLCAIVTAVKFYNDNFFSNEFYARLGQVSFKELCYMQTKFLLLIDFKLHVSDRQLYFLEHQVRHFQYENMVDLSTASEHHSQPNLDGNGSNNHQSAYSNPCEHVKLKFVHLSPNKLKIDLQGMWEQKNQHYQLYTSCCTKQSYRCLCFIKKQIYAFRKLKKKMQQGNSQATQGIQPQDQVLGNCPRPQMSPHLPPQTQLLRKPGPRPPGPSPNNQIQSERTTFQLNPTRTIQLERNNLPNMTSSQSQTQQRQSTSNGISEAYIRLGQQLNQLYEYGCCSGSTTHEQSLIALGISDKFISIGDFDSFNNSKKQNFSSINNSDQQGPSDNQLVNLYDQYGSDDIFSTVYDDQFVLCRQQKIPTNAGIAASILIIAAYIIMHAKLN